MRHFASYLAPLASLLALLLGLYSFYCFNFVPAKSAFFTALFFVYAFLVLMSFWALATAFFSDPGFVPLQYEYDQSKFTATSKALIDQVVQQAKQMDQINKESLIQTDYASISPSHTKKPHQFQLVLPLDSFRPKNDDCQS